MTFPRSPVKLDDSDLHGPGSTAELFVVEGDSASLAVGRVRDATFQAVLPMQGKPLNAVRASEKKVRAHALFTALTEAIGAGLGDAFALDQVRYDRILLLMDPDADGIHCGALMLMFFHRWMQPLLASGRIQMVRPPWGEVTIHGEDQPRYAQSEAQFQAHCEDLRGRDVAFTTLRYRGLAGIHLPVLHATCIAPATRWTAPMGVADAETAMRMFGSG